MMISDIPREFARQSIPVVSGTGTCVVNLIGYLDAVIIDAPASETYTFSIKGPLGIEYYIVPITLTVIRGAKGGGGGFYNAEGSSIGTAGTDGTVSISWP